MKILHPNKLIICAMLMLLSQFVNAQNEINAKTAQNLTQIQSTTELKKLCGTKDLAQIEQDDPQHAEQLRIIEERTQHFIQNKTEHKSASAVVTIPVVFHVIHTGTTSTTNNIPDVYLLAQLAQLNDDFRRMNSDADNTWSQAADTEIQFCLADTAPDGSSTTGINRYQATTGTWTTTNFDNTVKPQTIWDRDSYLNIWVVPNPIIANGDQLLGYAQFPGGTANTDGVVIKTSSTGSIATPNPSGGSSGLGRTGTHEVGHWLNLRHIWGDGNCSFDDLVGDTPLSDNFNRDCAIGHISCGSVDMVQNYMDYSDDACVNLFTQGQKNRMIALFQPGGARVSLLSSGACGTDECPVAVSTNDISGDYCDGTNATVTADANPNVSYIWSSDIPTVIPVDATAASTVVDFLAPSACTIETANISLVATCTLDGVELFNGVVSTVNVYPAAPATSADLEALLTFDEGTCNEPVSVSVGCENFVTLVPDAGNPTFPANSGDMGTATYTAIYVTTPDCCPDGSGASNDLITDGSFEAGSFGGTWTEFSSNFGTPICDGSCLAGGGTGASDGNFWAWFGGIAASEVGSVCQSVTVPAGLASLTLSFDLQTPACDSPSDFMQVTIGGTQVFFVDGASPTCGVAGYVPRTIDLLAAGIADGATYTLCFESEIFAVNGGISNFFVDNVQLIAEEPSASDACMITVTGDYDCQDGWQFCDPTIDLGTQTLSTGTVHAQNEVISAGIVPAQTNVSLKAGQLIRLEGGFATDVEADVEINIEDCVVPTIPE